MASRYGLPKKTRSLLSLELIFCVADYLWELAQVGPQPRRKKRRCAFCFRAPFWAELFNIIPSLVYVAGTAHLFLMYMRLLTFLPGEPPSAPAAPVHLNENSLVDYQIACDVLRGRNISEAPLQLFPPNIQQEARDYRVDFAQADNISSRWFFFGDILFVLDSILYTIAWYQDNSQAENGEGLLARDESINSSFRRFDESSMVEDDISAVDTS